MLFLASNLNTKEALMKGSLTKALQWMNGELKANPGADWVDLANQASLRFDLSPKDGEFLVRRLFPSEEG